MKAKKIVSILLIFTMLLMLWGVNPIMTVEAATFKDYEYQLINGGSEVEIIGYSGPSGDIVIPAKIKGKPVTSIRDGSNYPEGVFDKKGIISVDLPDTMINIGYYAFSHNGLTEVEIPDSVTTIGNTAFAYNNLTSVIIGDGVTTIGTSAFFENNLTIVVIGNGVTTIEAAVFSHNNLTEVEIPDSVTTIGTSAFNDNNLTSVTIPDSVTTIGQYTFRGNNLTHVTIPGTVTSIASNAFDANQQTPGDLTIFGEAGSAAETLALNKGYTFVALPLESIEVTSPPDRTIYMVDESLDLTGLTVTAHSNDGSSVIVPVTMENISGFDSSALALGQTVAVTFAEQTASFSVDIIETLVEGIEVSGENDLSDVGVDGTLQMVASIQPKKATLQSVTWSVANATGEATIDPSGLLTGISEGTVTVVATANDGSEVQGIKSINVTGTIINVASIEVSGFDNVTTVEPKGTLQMIAEILPENATNQDITWSVTNGTGEARIDKSGLLKGEKLGTVIVTATANDGSGVSGSCEIAVWDDSGPIFGVFRVFNTIHGMGWESESSVDIEIYHEAALVLGETVTTDTGGNLSLEVIEYSMVPGDRIIATDGTITKEHIVTDLKITEVDLDDEYIYGTAEPDSTVAFWTTSAGSFTEGIVVDGTGNWSIDLSGEELIPHFAIFVTQLDVDGDHTCVEWPDNTFIDVFRDYNNMHGLGWESETSVDIEIYHEGMLVLSETVMTDTEGNFSLWEIEPAMEAGDRIVATDGTVTKEHIVTNLEITEVDVDAKYIRGTAEPGTSVAYWTERVNSYSEGFVVDSSGNWTIDLSDEELIPGFFISVAQYDIDTDKTVLGWPGWAHLNIFIDRNSLHGHGWESESSVNIEIYHADTLEFDTTVIANEYGDFNLWDIEYMMVAGDRIVATSGSIIKEHVITSLEITEFNEDAKYIRGTATPDTLIDYWIDPSGSYGAGVTVDGSGEWIIDLTVEELAPGFRILIGQLDIDQDKTCVEWPRYAFMHVNRDRSNLHGGEWNSESPVSVEVYHDSVLVFSDTVNTDTEGYFDLRITGYSLAAGDKVVATSGTVTKEHIVTDIAISNLDEVAKEIYGTAEPGAYIAYFTNREDSYSDGIVVDNSGNWSIDLSGEELIPGFIITVCELDIDNDKTSVEWPENTYVDVFKSHDEMFGHGWESNSSVSIVIENSGVPAGTDADGNFHLRDIEPPLSAGVRIVVSDGITTKEHVVTEVAISNLDEAAKEIYGTAEPGAYLAYWTNREDSYTEGIRADDNGNWIIDLYSEELVPGFSIVVCEPEMDRDKTCVKWVIPE